MIYQFPRTIYVDRNNLRKQLEHVTSELLEAATAHDAGEPPARVVEELVDAIHSLETACRIMQELYAVDVALLMEPLRPSAPLADMSAQFADVTVKWGLVMQAADAGLSALLVTRGMLLVIDSLEAACRIMERPGVSLAYIADCVVSKNRVRGYYGCEA